MAASWARDANDMAAMIEALQVAPPSPHLDLGCSIPSSGPYIFIWFLQTHVAAMSEAVQAALPKLAAATAATLYSDFDKPQRHLEV